MYDIMITKPITRHITTMDTTISAGWEEVNLKLKIRRGRDIIENKSVIFLYLILLTAMPSFYGLYLLIKMTITNATSVKINTMKSSP